MSATDLRAALPRRSAENTTGASPAPGRQAGEGVPARSPAAPRTLSLGSRLALRPDIELPTLPGAGGWDAGAA